MDSRRIAIFVLGALLALAAFFSPVEVAPQAKMVFAITVLAVVYWFSEVLPLHVTGLLVSFLLVLFGGFSPGQIFPNYFDPVVVLLLGGFMLAFALEKFELDELIALRVLKHVGHSPSRIVLAFMAITAFLSFWVSNTAAAAVMIPIALFILRKNKLATKDSSFAKVFLLCVAYAATIGGLGTLVGSTPNPLAQRYIQDLGQSFEFLDWSYYGLPFVVVFLLVIWFVVLRIFKPEISGLKIDSKEIRMDRSKWLVLAIFIATVFLWVTGSLTGLSSSVVALVPILLLYFTRLVEENDFSKINWPILSLIGSGIALGFAFHGSGFDLFIASLVEGLITGLPLLLVIFIVVVVSVLLTMLASNTASAAIMIPLVIPLAPVIGIRPEILIVIVAIGVSLDFTAPMGTPPNAIAFSTGFLSVKEMAKVGLLLSLLASILVALLATFIWV